MLAGMTFITALAAAAATLIYSGATGTNVIATRTLTPDGADTYAMTKTAGTLTTAASPTNAGANLRRVAVPSGTPNLADTRVCATWTYRSAPEVQEGLAHRVVAEPGRTRAVTVTKNVIYGIYWVFNLHTWDTARADGRPDAFAQVAQFDMGPVMFGADGTYRPLPWRVCTEAQGTTVRFKIWFPGEMAEPAWTDPAYARSATLPAGWTGAGRSGWYAGHVPPGGSARYTNLGIWSLT